MPVRGGWQIGSCECCARVRFIFFLQYLFIRCTMTKACTSYWTRSNDNQTAHGTNFYTVAYMVERRTLALLMQSPSLPYISFQNFFSWCELLLAQSSLLLLPPSKFTFQAKLHHTVDLKKHPFYVHQAWRCKSLCCVVLDRQRQIAIWIWATQ